jgi:ATP-dependent Clp protease ATP-binding subunit ClpA
MNLNQFTQKLQEALAQAQNLAVQHRHQQVEAEHLLYALLQQPDGLRPKFFQKMDVPISSFLEGLEQCLSRIPQVSGPGAQPGNIYVTPRLSQILVEAQEEAKRLKDEYVSAEHVLLALLQDLSQPWSLLRGGKVHRIHLCQLVCRVAEKVAQAVVRADKAATLDDRDRILAAFCHQAESFPERSLNRAMPGLDHPSLLGCYEVLAP